MKKTISLLLFLTLLIPININAQSKADIKEAKKEAKDMASQGWKVTPGYLSLQEQTLAAKPILRAGREWIIGESMVSGDVYDAVKSNAMLQAKIDIAKQIETELTGESKTGIANEQKGAGKVASAVSFREEARSHFASKVKRPKILMDCYQNLKDGQIQILLRIAIPAEEAEKLYVSTLEEMKQQ